MKLSDEVRYLKGVGPARAASLAKLGIVTVEDLLYHFPRRTEDRTGTAAMKDVKVGETVSVRGMVTSVRSFGRRWAKGFRVTLADESGEIVGTWFRASFLKDRFERGQEVVFHGKVSLYKKQLTLSHPDFEIVSVCSPSLAVDRIVPMHPATEGLTVGVIRRLIHTALDAVGDTLVEWLPPDVVTERQLMDPVTAMRAIHFPEEEGHRLQALMRFKYEEFFLLQILMALRRQQAVAEPKSVGHRMWARLDGRIRDRLPFELTDAQDRAVKRIVGDMTSRTPMNRLLEGDVGSGKTAVAVYALLTAVANKGQTAFMAPTEVLAVQHYLTLTRLLKGSKVAVALLEGGRTGRARQKLLGHIARGEMDIVVGTHALIQDDVAFANLGLVVVDEQHKFGVAQRARILQKGRNPDFLLMTATPIPRTLSLTVFGDLDVTVIDEMPPGRLPATTIWARRAAQQRDAYGRVREQAALGLKSFVVFPAIEENEELPLKALETGAAKLRETVFADLRVGMLHGRMPRKEKENVMDAFRSGELDVLASTTVIEVGVDVPEATVMIVESADRFGLAQLHQLRGRIGRGGHPSWCYLFGQGTTPDAQARLGALEATCDGFRIAEEDLRIRGPGDFFGTRQHGLPALRCADLIEDMDILRQAREDAFALAKRCPGLDTPETRPIAKRLKNHYGRLAGMAGIG